jgi:hypothetical protein
MQVQCKNHSPHAETCFAKGKSTLLQCESDARPMALGTDLKPDAGSQTPAQRAPGGFPDSEDLKQWHS